ncbi:MAG: hypothetical protein JJU36_15765 [Phycisphaeraceae bacterium]|nr:hypothetical protein [Phycisphaeraceae bacterium]
MSHRTESPPRLLTVGRMAEILGVPVSRVRYVLATRPDIRHCALAGIARLYDRQALARIRHELSAIDARRAGGAQ